MTDLAQKERDSKLLATRALQVQRGGARAAVLGVNDGLVSTLCLVLGIAGAQGTQHAALLAGGAGLLAGAVSMAAGEWISVKSQVDLFQGILDDLKDLVKTDPELLHEQVEAQFESSGIHPATAATAADELLADGTHLHRMYATQVIGINPDELGSPWTAALSSFALFSLGSLVPLSIWLFMDGIVASILATLLTAVAGFGAGVYIGVSSGKNPVYSGLRQLLIVVLSAVVTYGVGYAVGMVMHI